MARFKKGSAAAKKYMASIRKKSKRSNSTIKKGGFKMAKRRKKKSYKRSSNSSSVKPIAVLIGGGIYGAARAKVSNTIAPWTAQIPLAGLSDEAAMFGISYILNKKFKNKDVKKIGLAGMYIESARIGEALTEGALFGNKKASPSGAGISYATLS